MFKNAIKTYMPIKYSFTTTPGLLQNVHIVFSIVVNESGFLEVE